MNKLKTLKITSFIVFMIMVIVNITPIIVLADIGGEQNTGGGSKNVKSGSGYTWSINNSGYRGL